MRTVAQYLRRSPVDGQHEDQIAATRTLVELRGWRVIETFLDDETARVELDRMLAAAHTRTFEVLVVYESRQVAKSLRELVVLVDQLRKAEVDLVSVREQRLLDTTASSPRRDALLELVSMFVPWEREALRTASLRALAAGRRRGAPTGRPRAQFSVARAARLRERGRTYEQIARELGVGIGTVYRALSNLPSSKTPLTNPVKKPSG